jgi:uncharacterized membrane protein YvbJ
MRKNKKAVEMTLQTIITLIIIVIVLLVLTIFFVKYYSGNSNSVIEIGKGATDMANNFK